MTLADKAREALKEDSVTVLMEYGIEFARTVIAAEALADALDEERVRHREHNHLITSGVKVGRAVEISARASWIEAQKITDKALDAYRKATEPLS
jgi:hypothetical protein